MAVALLCGAAMVACTEKLEDLPEVTSAVTPSESTPNPSGDPTAPTPFNSTYVPLEELLTGEWEMSTDSFGVTDIHRSEELMRSLLGATGYTTWDGTFILSELSWQGLLNTIAGFDTGYIPRHVRMTFENNVMHVDCEDRFDQYDENNNFIGFDTVPILIPTDFTIEQENDCRIHFTPIDPDNWWPSSRSHPEYDNRLIICSLNRDRFVVFHDAWFCSFGGEPGVALFRRVR